MSQRSLSLVAWYSGADMQWIGDFFTTLLKRISEFATFIKQLFLSIINTLKAFAQFNLDCLTQLFVDAWEIITDQPVWVFDKLLDLVLSAVQQLDVSGISQAIGAFGQLPAEIVNMLGLIGVGEALGIITTALIIRLILQLIPFVRLGS